MMEIGRLRVAHEVSRSGKPPHNSFSDDLIFHHPFLNGSLQGPEAFARFWFELERAAGPVTFTRRFDTAAALDDPNKPWHEATAGLGDARIEETQGFYRICRLGLRIAVHGARECGDAREVKALICQEKIQRQSTFPIWIDRFQRSLNG